MLFRSSFLSPGWPRPRGGLQALLLEAKGQPLIALAKSLFVFSAFVQGCKDSKEEELEELPQVKGHFTDGEPGARGIKGGRGC